MSRSYTSRHALSVRAQVAGAEAVISHLVTREDDKHILIHGKEKQLVPLLGREQHCHA